ncbi:MAG: metallophosphoesterase family protein [Chloroflexota bacterium]
MRIAIFSDIHGNSIGLDAVLADIEAKGGVDHYWVLGDHVGNGPDPVGVMQRLMKLKNANFIRGNADRYVANGDRPPPYAEDVIANPALVEQYGEVQGNFAWTAGIMVEFGWMNWLKNLPFHLEKTLPDGTRVLAYHASPWADDSYEWPEFSPNTPKKDIQKIADGCDAELIFFGHTHWPLDQMIGHKRLVNVGSVGNPVTPSLSAYWSLLQTNEQDYNLTHFSVSYDQQAVIEQISKKHHPGAKFISSIYRGKHIKKLVKQL